MPVAHNIIEEIRIKRFIICIGEIEYKKKIIAI
jgi:hypothetical protein